VQETRPALEGKQAEPEGEGRGLSEESKKARERQRKVAKLQRSLEVAELNLAKARIAVEIGDLKYRDALAQAEKEFELAKKRQQIFAKMTAPNRKARAELELQQAEDGLLEARQELEQLELMYRDEQFADQTKEIVIERARRRLERTQRDLELRREELRVLIEVSLPLEQEELDLAAELKKRAVLQVERDNESGIIDRKVAVLNAEAEVARLEQELSDAREELEAGGEQRPQSGESKP